MSNLDNMILCLRCAEAFTRTLESGEVGDDIGYTDFDPNKFDREVAPLMIRWETLRHPLDFVEIVAVEMVASKGKVTECLVFRFAHQLYHEAFSTSPESGMAN